MASTAKPEVLLLRLPPGGGQANELCQHSLVTGERLRDDQLPHKWPKCVGNQRKSARFLLGLGEQVSSEQTTGGEPADARGQELLGATRK